MRLMEISAVVPVINPLNGGLSEEVVHKLEERKDADVVDFAVNNQFLHTLGYSRT